MDLVRLIVLKIEEKHTSPTEVLVYDDFDEELLIEGYSPGQVEYHLRLAMQAGLFDVPRNAGGLFAIRGLTPAGHDFADSVRDPKIWRAAQAGAMAAGGSTIELLMDLAKGLIRKKVAQATGVEL
ncbi:DUF2513 domain-containing protein [Pseudomonas sp. D2-5]